MKYICLGYIEPDKFENLSESERKKREDEDRAGQIAMFHDCSFID